ncbi:MAG: FkbM family methyltransferase [Gammaproteobacteria bacterium]
MHFWNSPESKAETKFIYKEIFEERCYEKHGITLSDGDTVFDVGANIGMFACSLMDRYDNLKLFCFEPVPNTRSCLERNVGESSKHANHQVSILAVALGSQNYESTISFFPSAPGNSTLYLAAKMQEFDTLANGIRLSDLWKTKKSLAVLMLFIYPFKTALLRQMSRKFLGSTEAISCQVSTLSQVIREQRVKRIDLLKIDVEGAELDVIAGIEDGHWPLIGQITMEVAPANKAQLPAVFDRLRALGFAKVLGENMFAASDLFNNPGPCTIYATRTA